MKMSMSEANPLELSVGRWGNSLAVRLPAELARELGLQEGSRVQAYVQDGALHVQPERAAHTVESRQRLLERIERLHASLPVTAPVSRDELSRY